MAQKCRLQIFDHNFIIFLIFVQFVTLSKSYDYNSIKSNHNQHHNKHHSINNKANYAHGYGIADSRYFRHGTPYNEQNGGTCSEFLQINSLDQCCAHRDDDCYMIHYDTRCYCDIFCDRSHKADNSDCCPDAGSTCSGNPPAQPECFKNGVYFKSGEKIKDNCNECNCVNGNLECTQNDCLINVDILNDVNQNGHTWHGENYSIFWQKTLEYGYKYKLGTQLPIREQRPLQAEDKPAKVSYDFRDEPYMRNRRDLIRDQGNCAASWAFSTIDVANDRTAKVYKGSRGNESTSVQMLISCIILPGNANGCSPASVDVAWKFIEHTNKGTLDGKAQGGLVNEKCYPYTSGQTGVATECKINLNSKSILCPSDGSVYNKPLLSVAPAYPLRVESPNDIMDEIIRNGPVQIVFKVFDDFFMYKGGIYSKHPKAKVANVRDPYHSVKVLGWGSENGVDYWIAANSWGTDWGENGYFRIKREDDETEFGRHVYGGWGSRPINTNHKNSLNRKRNRNIQRRE